MILKVDNIHTYYGESHALQGVSLSIEEGETVCLLGRNGAGKSTTLRSIIGLTPPRQGAVFFDDQNVTGPPASRIARLGMSLVPEDRRLVPGLAGRANPEMGVYHRAGGGSRWTDEGVLDRT